MSAVRKTNPVGLDSYIDRLQTVLDSQLDWPGLKVYPRAEKKFHKDGFTIEHYDGKGEYKSMMVSEENKIFFVPDDRRTSIGGARESVNLNIVAIVDVESAYETITHRADEEARVDFIRALRTSGIRPEYYLETVTGIDEIRRALRDIMRGAVKFGDIQPYHIFMVRIDARYDNNC